MKESISIVDDLVIELAAIRDGRCVWCAMHRPHPSYSQCFEARYHVHDQADHEDGRVYAMAPHVLEVA